MSRSMCVFSPGGSLEPNVLETPMPGVDQVKVEIAACGMCRADIGTTEADTGFPITPGHEIAGTIVELGPGTREAWSVGDRVAVGWFGGSCGRCDYCRRGDVVHCPDRRITGVGSPGGWAETIIADKSTLARIPADLDFDTAAPMGCAGVTMFNATRTALAGARTGMRLAVVGLGGLGHLGVQFASAFGFEVFAVARGESRRDFALSLGADHFIDSSAVAPGSALAAAGGVDAIINTAPAPELVPGLLDGLQPRGQLILTGTGSEPASVPVGKMVAHALRITGHITGSPVDTEAAMDFALRNGIRPVTDRRPLGQAADALEDLRAARIHGRIVLEP
jgi:D-arabinose 1-dehydrogenase-like Zn-dependent alcohol dehydrogenase